MGAITTTGNDVYRDFETAGVPASGAHEPEKAAIRSLQSMIDAGLSSLATFNAVGVGYATKAAMDGDLAHAAGTLAAVYNDSTAASNGFYVKTGTAGTGSWSVTNIGLPATFAADLAATNVSLAGKLNKAGDTMSGVLDMQGNHIAFLADPFSPQDPVTLSFHTTAVSALVGGADTNNNTLGKLAGHVNDLNTAKLSKSGGQMTGEIDMGGSSIRAVNGPTLNGDATNKLYVDTLVSSVVGGADSANNTLQKVGLRITTEIPAAISAIKGGADGDNETLQKVGQRVTTEITNRQAAVAGVIGGADSSNDTLGKIATRVDGVKATADGNTTALAATVPVVQETQARVGLDQAQRRATAPYRPRDGYIPAYGIDPSGRAAGLFDKQGRITVGGVIFKSSGPYRDHLSVKPLGYDAAENMTSYIDAKGITHLTEFVSYEVTPVRARDGVAPRALWRDIYGNPFAAISDVGEVLVRIAGPSIAGISPAYFPTAPRRAIAYQTGTAPNRKAMLFVDGYTTGTPIAVDQDITDIVAVASTAQGVEIVAQAGSSGPLRRISINLWPTSSLALAVTRLRILFGRGQSNRDGHNNDAPVTPNAVNPRRVVSLVKGDRLLQSAQEIDDLNTVVRRSTLTGFQDLVTLDNGTASQSISATLGDGIVQRAPTTDGFLIINSAIGSSSAAQRLPGTVPYNNFLIALEEAVKDARLLGLDVDCPWFDSIDGEADAGDSKSTWLAKMIADQAAIEADVQRITLKTNRVIRATCQMAAGTTRSGVTLAQLQAALDDPTRFICVGAKYFLDPDDVIHLSGISQAIWGYYYARAYNRKFVDGVDPIPPYIGTATRPTGSNVVTCTILGDFTSPIVIDTALVTNPGNYGIQWADSGNGNSVSVSSVGAVYSGNKFDVTLSAAPTATTGYIYCARAPTVGQIGPTAGPRSNFRDSSADATPLILGVSYPMYRWLSHWETTVTVV